MQSCKASGFLEYIRAVLTCSLWQWLMYYNEAVIGSSNFISILLCLFIVVDEETNKEIIVTLNLKATKILL